MTLDACYAEYQGKTVDIDGHPENAGQCVQWADLVLNLVYGFPYHYANAIDWWNRPGELLNNFTQVSDGSIKKGDFVIFNQQVGSVYGHIDVAMQDGTTSNYQGSDSNWSGNLTVHLVQHANPNWVLGSLRFKGADMPPDPNQINQLVTLCWGPGAATQPDITKLNAQATLQAALNLILGDGRTAAWDKRVYQLEANQSGTINVSINGTEYVPKG